MAMCIACSELKRRPLDAPRHDQLEPAGTCSYRSMNRAITVEHFRCRNCALRWTYTNDVKDLRAGWRTMSESGQPTNMAAGL